MICRNTTPSFKNWKLFVLRYYLDLSSNITTHNCPHILCDASYSPFATVACFVYDVPYTDTFDTSFVLRKAPVAPLKQHTITELEIQVAVLGTRIANFVKRESALPIIQTFYWSDYSAVIHWIRCSHKRQQICIANRVCEILETTTVHQWRQCTGNINSTDHATRGLLIVDLTEHCRWF